MENTETVADGTTDNRKGTFGRNKTFQYLGITSMTFQLCIQEISSLDIMFLHHDQHVRQHRMNYETIIIVHVKINSITIHSIPFIPFVTEFFHSIQHPFHVTISCKLQQSSFDGRSKKQPVVFKRLDITAPLQFGNHPFFCLRIKIPPKLFRSTQ